MLLRTERSSDNFISVRIIKGNSVYDVSVAFQSQQLVARDGVPHFACSIVTSRDELVTRLVERTIRKGQNVCSKDLKQEEVT